MNIKRSSMMKKILAIILSMMILISASFVLANAANETPQLEVSSTMGKVGDIVSVDVSLNNNPGITALQIKIHYSSNLEIVSVDDEKLFDDSISTSRLSANPLIVSWYAKDSGNKSSNGTLFSIKFKILDNAATSDIIITYDEDNIFDSDFNNKYFDTQNGQVVVESDITEPTPDYKFGDVNLDGVVNVKDATLIQRIVVEEAGLTVTDDQRELADINGDGTISVKDATALQIIIVNT